MWEELETVGGIYDMNDRDWDFAIGSLGDPLFDIMDWMICPYPQCLVNNGFYERSDNEQTR